MPSLLSPHDRPLLPVCDSRGTLATGLCFQEAPLLLPLLGTVPGLGQDGAPRGQRRVCHEDTLARVRPGEDEVELWPFSETRRPGPSFLCGWGAQRASGLGPSLRPPVVGGTPQCCAQARSQLRQAWPRQPASELRPLRWKNVATLLRAETADTPALGLPPAAWRGDRPASALAFPMMLFRIRHVPSWRPSINNAASSQGGQ